MLLWGWRRMVVPLSCFIERPLQSWTRDAAALIGTVPLRVDYRAVVNVQVVETRPQTIELHARN